MLQEKNAPEKNFSPREEEKKLRELSLACIEEVLQIPYHKSDGFLLELLEIFKDLTEKSNDTKPFDKFFYNFGEKAMGDITDKESFFRYCLFSPISLFVFETEDYMEAKERFSKLSTSICSLIENRLGKQDLTLLKLYRLFQLESTLTDINFQDFLNRSTSSSITNSKLFLISNLLNSKASIIEYTFKDIDSWLESTRLP